MSEKTKKSDFSGDYLLEVRGLKKYFELTCGFRFGKTNRRYLRAVDNVSFALRPGETLGLVGESGCGKSTTGNCIIRLLDPTEGEILFEGIDVAKAPERRLQLVRKEIQMIFQDPYSSLNPRLRVKDLIAEPFWSDKSMSSAQREKEIYRLLEIVGLPRDYAGRFPHEFSGGQRQRIGIARALARKPKLIICDEPISALDVSIQAQILNLLAALQKEFALTYIFISHALASIRYVSTQVAVMYLGRIVEFADTETLFREPSHPYTEGLMAAVPVSDPALRENKKRIILEGDIPSPAAPPSGCHFHPRCRYADAVCGEVSPSFMEIKPGHCVACHHPLKPGDAITAIGS